MFVEIKGLNFEVFSNVEIRSLKEARVIVWVEDKYGKGIKWANLAKPPKTWRIVNGYQRKYPQEWFAILAKNSNVQKAVNRNLTIGDSEHKL